LDTIINACVFNPDQVKTRMYDLLNIQDNEISQTILYTLDRAGKMLRPRLVFSSANLFPNNSELVLDIAVAVELIHMASLVHDDVIDKSMLRRGRKSLNACFGNNASVLTGDYLFATAFHIINSHEMTPIMTEVTQAIQNMCAGEIQQMALAFNPNITEGEYWEKTYGKTACLFATSCKVGALASSMPAKYINNLRQYGLCLGYAYQIIDDVLDFVADSQSLGKPAGNDLREGNITLPVIYLLKHSNYAAWIRSIINQGKITNAEITKIINMVLDSEAIDYSINRSRQCLELGLNHLRKIPANNSSIKELEDLSVYLMEGYYKQAANYSHTLPKKEVR
jgi:heptaprenyl diphosphate synthase